MRRKLYEALDECFGALETGADPGTVLTRFPDMQDDLAPLLDASRQARLLAVQEIPEIVLLRNKAIVLQQAAGMRKSIEKPRQRRSINIIPRLAFSLTIALFFLFSGTGLVRASTRALPGDDLYPVKRTWEDVRLIFALSPKGREELEMEFEGERLEEVDELLAEKRYVPISFMGLVTEQNEDLWQVSGISVQITPESKLPAEAVTVGTAIMVEGRTNGQGFVEVDRIEILESGISIPQFMPRETEDSEEPGNTQISDGANEDQSWQNESSSDEKDGDSEDRHRSTSREGSSSEVDGSNYDQYKEDSYRDSHNEDGYSERGDGEIKPEEAH